MAQAQLTEAAGYIPSAVEGYIPSAVEGYIPSAVEGYIPSAVEGPAHLDGSTERLD